MGVPGKRAGMIYRRNRPSDGSSDGADDGRSVAQRFQDAGQGVGGAMEELKLLL